MPTLRDLLTDGKPHIVDGAMGTMLHHQGAPGNLSFDEMALRRPDLVRAVHLAYVKAGAELLETNSFGANPIKLASAGLSDETEALNAAAARVAREAAGKDVAVLGAIGPLGVRLEPFGELSVAEAEQAFGRQIDGLLQGGVDGFVLETFSDIPELEAAIRAVRARSDLAIIAQVTVGDDAATAYGTAPEVFGPALVAAGADAVGVNCSTGPSVVLEAIERLARVISVPLTGQPNAGQPRDVGDRKLYVASPEYVGEYARRMVEAGARLVGGCCGTTPEHIAAIKRYTRAATTSGPARVGNGALLSAEPDSEGVAPVPLLDRSRLGAKLARGEFVTTVEIVPPRGANAEPLLAQARALRAAGIDAVNIPDGPRAQSRMSALLSALMIERDAGLEAIPHYACRDRNLLGMLSDLLGAAAAGLRNLLIVTGDPPKMGPYPEATAVFDIDAIGLTNLVARLNRGLDPGGNTLGAPTSFVHGVGVNPAAPDLERELSRYAWKVDAGACFAMTQPVFDVAQLNRSLDRLEAYGIPMIVGVWPLVSLRNAEFLANEVPGVTVPEVVLQRMRTASAVGREAALAEGVAIAKETVAAIRGRVAGVQVAAPLGRVDVAVEVAGGGRKG
jgi:methionine synthase I (cobalamin-dependent)/5,10-methylenetetrahydrofolate reductase